MGLTLFNSGVKHYLELGLWGYRFMSYGYSMQDPELNEWREEAVTRMVISRRQEG